MTRSFVAIPFCSLVSAHSVSVAELFDVGVILKHRFTYRGESTSLVHTKALPCTLTLVAPNPSVDVISTPLYFVTSPALFVMCKNLVGEPATHVQRLAKGAAIDQTRFHRQGDAGRDDQCRARLDELGYNRWRWRLR